MRIDPPACRADLWWAGNLQTSFLLKEYINYMKTKTILNRMVCSWLVSIWIHRLPAPHVSTYMKEKNPIHQSSGSCRKQSNKCTRGLTHVRQASGGFPIEFFLCSRAIRIARCNVTIPTGDNFQRNGPSASLFEALDKFQYRIALS